MIFKLLTLVAMILLVTLPILLRVQFAAQAQARAQKNAFDTSKRQRAMTEALNVLELPSNPSKKQIKEAHKKLMRQNHPDLGGSKFLATKINVARDVLLKEAA